MSQAGLSVSAARMVYARIMLQVHQFPCLSDNYGFLLHDPQSGETACIDTPDAEEYLQQARALSWTITQIWNTHWHRDHAGGNEVIKAATGCKITAPLLDAEKIPAVDRTVRDGDLVSLGDHTAQVIDVGGHTMGHIAYHLSASALAFVGDALFALGCGRMFEGTAPQFWDSMLRLRGLPDNTTLYCAHEYTQANARFALHADPENTALAGYAQEIAQKRTRGEWTVPFALQRERETNPFLRADTPEMQARWGGKLPHETFAALRAAKDGF